MENGFNLPTVNARAAFLRILAHVIETEYSLVDSTQDMGPVEDFDDGKLDSYVTALEAAVAETVRLLFAGAADIEALKPALRAWVIEAGWCWPEVDRATGDVPDPAIRVLPVGGDGQWGEWKISTDLTDRWGEINENQWPRKPFVALLGSEGLLDCLREQMVDESTFVARKDGRFGLLFEVEYMSKESEGSHGEGVEYKLKNQATINQLLIDGMSRLVEQFPGVEFCVPTPEVVIYERPAAWAFMPDGALNEDQRNELARALSAL